MHRLSNIETFVLVAEKGSLAEAAKKLKISPAAVSKQITKLESDLKVQLLARSTRKVALTDMGRAYLGQCRRILEEVNAAETLVAQMTATPSGTLKVCSPPHFAARYITPHLPEFCTLFPEIELHLDIVERFPSLQTENLDVMIGASISAGGDAVQKRIATTRYTICASPEYLKIHGTPKTPEELIHHKCLAHSGRSPMDRFYLQNRREVAFHPHLSVNDAGTLARLAAIGMGIVQLHFYVVREAIQVGKLVPILEEHTRRDVPIYLALPPKRYTPGKVRCFVDFISEKLAQSAL